MLLSKKAFTERFNPKEEYMSPKRQWWMVLLLAAAVSPAAVPTAHAQSYPKGPVTIIVPFTAGGPIDGILRLMQPSLEKKWGQSVVIDSRPGGGTMIGNTVVARATPDGQTLLATGNGAITGRIFLKEVPYEASDLRPLMELMWAGRVLQGSAALPAKTFKEFIAYAKANPKKLNYGSIPATSFELDYNVLLDKMGVQMTGLPYPGTAAIRLALVRNDIQFAMEPIGEAVAQQVAAGNMTALAVTTAQRHATFPNTPTLKELGIDYEFTASVGLWAPAKTPEPIVARIYQDVAAVMATPEVVAVYHKFGWEPSTLTTKEYAEKEAGELKLYTDAAQRAGLKPQ
jgi:tripartite-type tricarboxylate transporter receptor subunit TctC